jgi:hypothetical protein
VILILSLILPKQHEPRAACSDVQHMQHMRSTLHPHAQSNSAISHRSSPDTCLAHSSQANPQCQRAAACPAI